MTAVSTGIPSQPARTRRTLTVPPSATPWLVFAALFLVGGILRPGLLSVNGLFTTAGFAAILAIVSYGQTIVIVQGGIDLSIPFTITLAALTYLTAVDSLGPVGAFVPVALVGLTVGLLNGLGVSFLGLSPIVTTIAMNGLLFGVVLLKFNLSQVGNPPQLLTNISSAKVTLLGASIPAAVLVALALGLVLQAVLAWTGWGRRLYLVGSTPEAARLSGIRVNRTRIWAYVASALLSSFGGVIIAGFYQQTSVGMGDAYLLGSVAAVVVGGAAITGGRGTVLGTLGGALVLAQVQTLVLVANLSVNFQQIVYGLLVLLVVAVGRVKHST